MKDTEITKINPWDRACKKGRLTRTDPLGRQGKIDRGVNYFILALEKMGLVTQWSCSGHPRGFYIVFDAPYETACRISSWGYFSVSIVSPGSWRLDYSCQPENERDHRRSLRWAAEVWEKNVHLFQDSIEAA